MLIGLTNRPDRAKSGALIRCFGRIILVPRPDYGNRWALWKHFITKNLGNAQFPDIDISTLTMVTKIVLSALI